nr:hypothetical protein [Mycobacterium helveticum]
MATGPEPPAPDDFVTAEAAELAERRAAAARERAAHAGLSAAESFEASARAHEQVARVQDHTVDQGASHSAVHRESATRHRAAAAEDREIGTRKRQESEADLSSPPEPAGLAGCSEDDPARHGGGPGPGAPTR